MDEDLCVGVVDGGKYWPEREKPAKKIASVPVRHARQKRRRLRVER